VEPSLGAGHGLLALGWFMRAVVSALYYYSTLTCVNICWGTFVFGICAIGFVFVGRDSLDLY
jgi:uncharacterized membrane protein